MILTLIMTIIINIIEIGKKKTYLDINSSSIGLNHEKFIRGNNYYY